MTAALTMPGHASDAEILSRAELLLLAECEQTIERGLTGYIEVGMALGRVREQKLYRAQYRTFLEYCSARWGITDSRARQLALAAETVTTVTVAGLPAPATERQARELARVPEADRAEVWRDVNESAGKVTAEKIRQVAEERAEPKPAADLTPQIVSALTSAGPSGMTAWQLAFLIDPAGPDTARATLALRMAPILEQLEAEGRACVVGEVDGGMLWALAELVERQPTEAPGPVDAEIPTPPADPGSTSPEPGRHLHAVREEPAPEQVEAERMETQRVQIVERARRRAPRLVPEIRDLFTEVMSGMNLGETGLVTPQTIADIRALVDALEARMEATQ